MKKIVMAAIVVAALALAASAPTIAAQGIDRFAGDLGVSAIGGDAASRAQDVTAPGSVGSAARISPPGATYQTGSHTAAAAAAARPAVAAPRSLPATSTR